jgi:hypothetical protein
LGLASEDLDLQLRGASGKGELRPIMGVALLQEVAAALVSYANIAFKVSDLLQEHAERRPLDPLHLG